jgi:hypothetical protein
MNKSDLIELAEEPLDEVLLIDRLDELQRHFGNYSPIYETEL